jgi:hypothetical protein
MANSNSDRSVTWTSQKMRSVAEQR